MSPLQITAAFVSIITLSVILIRWWMDHQAEKPNLKFERTSITQNVHMQGGKKEVGVEARFIVTNQSKLNNTIVKSIMKFNSEERRRDAYCLTLVSKNSETLVQDGSFVFPNAPLPKESPIELTFIDTYGKTYRYLEIIKLKDIN